MKRILFGVEAVTDESPWLIPHLARAPRALRALTDPVTFLDVHRQVQGERLLARTAAAEGCASALPAA